jgi:diphthamide synthase (EF-2-diphthine--ammonia ligase)
LTRATAEEIRKSGADICGENGEYHTFVFDGPIFAQPVPFQKQEIIRMGKYAVLGIA